MPTVFTENKTHRKFRYNRYCIHVLLVHLPGKRVLPKISLHRTADFGEDRKYYTAENFCFHSSVMIGPTVHVCVLIMSCRLQASPHLNSCGHASPYPSRNDIFGLPVTLSPGTDLDAAMESFNTAAEYYVNYSSAPVEALAKALEADPNFFMAHLVQVSVALYSWPSAELNGLGPRKLRFSVCQIFHTCQVSRILDDLPKSRNPSQIS